MYKLNDIKKIKKKIEDLKFLKMYFYSKYKKNKVNQKILELNKELKILTR